MTIPMLRVELINRHYSQESPALLIISEVRRDGASFYVTVQEEQSLQSARLALTSLPDWQVVGISQGGYRLGMRGGRDLRHLSSLTINNMLRVANGPIPPLTAGLTGGIEIIQLLPEVEGNPGTTAFVDATPDFVAGLDARAWVLRAAMGTVSFWYA
eukprot:sb/3473087/